MAKKPIGTKNPLKRHRSPLTLTLVKVDFSESLVLGIGNKWLGFLEWGQREKMSRWCPQGVEHIAMTNSIKS